MREIRNKQEFGGETSWKTYVLGDKAERRRIELIGMIGMEVVKVGGRRIEPSLHKVAASDVINFLVLLTQSLSVGY